MAKKRDLLNEIKEMEDRSRLEALRSGGEVQAPTSEELVEFDSWYATRSNRIPNHHMKEILAADFKGRGLSMQETMEKFDKALCHYGIKLS